MRREQILAASVEELGRTTTAGAVAAVWPLEVVVATAEGDAVVLVQAGPLEALDEGVEGTARWKTVVLDAGLEGGPG